MHEQTLDELHSKAFKVILVGVQSVGKSSLLYRLIQQKFSSSYLATVGIDFKAYPVYLGAKVYSLQIWDTAGQEKFRALTASYYKGAHACICVFDLSKIESLQKCDYYIEKALEEEISAQCIFLLGNKADLGEQNAEIGQEYAKKYGIRYRTVSALKGNNVTEVFQELAVLLAGNFGEVITSSNKVLKSQEKKRERNCQC